MMDEEIMQLKEKVYSLSREEKHILRLFWAMRMNDKDTTDFIQVVRGTHIPMSLLTLTPSEILVLSAALVADAFSGVIQIRVAA